MQQFVLSTDVTVLCYDELRYSVKHSQTVMAWKLAGCSKLSHSTWFTGLGLPGDMDVRHQRHLCVLSGRILSGRSSSLCLVRVNSVRDVAYRDVPPIFSILMALP